MWYFSWILGTALAVTLTIGCAIWLEFRLQEKQNTEPKNH